MSPSPGPGNNAKAHRPPASGGYGSRWFGKDLSRQDAKTAKETGFTISSSLRSLRLCEKYCFFFLSEAEHGTKSSRKSPTACRKERSVEHPGGPGNSLWPFRYRPRQSVALQYLLHRLEGGAQSRPADRKLTDSGRNKGTRPDNARNPGMPSAVTYCASTFSTACMASPLYSGGQKMDSLTAIRPGSSPPEQAIVASVASTAIHHLPIALPLSLPAL